MRVFVHGGDDQLRAGLSEAADKLGAELVDWDDRVAGETNGGAGPHVLIAGSSEIDSSLSIARAALYVICRAACV